MSFIRMASLWILIISLNIIFPVHAVDFNQSSFVSVKSGELVTLNCTFQETHKKELMAWYKQQFGEMPREVGKIRAYVDTQTSPEFSSGFKIAQIPNGISLTILRTKKANEGLYFCGLYTWGMLEFSSGTFVTVTDGRDVKVSVSQIGVSDSVPAGASVTLQCSVLSESRAAELRVLWFRAAPSQSHPQIIYTQHSSSRQCESGSSTHTCVYSFSKNISLRDTGTYYCAVAMCGKIVFGNGTRVQMALVDPVVICLAVALGVCVLVIFVQAVLNYKRRNSDPCSVRFQGISNQVIWESETSYSLSRCRCDGAVAVKPIQQNISEQRAAVNQSNMNGTVSMQRHCKRPSDSSPKRPSFLTRGNAVAY